MKNKDFFKAAFVICLLAASLSGAIFLSPQYMASIGHGHLIKNINTSEKVVALTFDDGPYPVLTMETLKILDNHKIKATFFVIGNRAVRYPDLVKAIAARGHAIGNHTYTHPPDFRRLTGKELLYEIDKSENLISALTGIRPTIFRPPRGIINRKEIELLARNGYTTVLWSASPYHGAADPVLMAERVVDRIRPGGIILMHDGRIPIRWKDVKAAGLVIEMLQKKGWRFVTVPQLLRMRK
jgi:peptidoglycan-N-acetylglucosamine deacetylase